MSLDTLAIMDVAAPLDPHELLVRLAAEPSLAALVPAFGDEWEPKAWSAEPSSTDARAVDLVGPGGVVVRLGRRSAEVYHLIPFSRFSAGGDEHRLVRRAFRAIARLVGAKRAIYTHELNATDRDPDQGADHVEASLARNVGPPATSFEELHAAESYRDRSWYVDAFTDLDAN